MKTTEFSARTSEAAEALCISAKTLRRLITEGVLTLGTHFRYAGTGAVRPQLRWNVAACDTTLTVRSRRRRRQATATATAGEVG